METIFSNLTKDIFTGGAILGIVQLFLLLRKYADLDFLKSAGVSLVIVFTSFRGYLLIVYFLLGIYLIVMLSYSIYKKMTASKVKEKPKILPRTSDETIYLESNKGTITVENTYRGSIIVGGAGAGKSKSLFYPYIQQFLKNSYTGILYDFKGELSELAHYYKREGVNFKILSFKDYTISTRVNPLDPKYVTKQAIAQELATVLINNLLPESIKSKDYWTRSSISILAAAIWYLRKTEYSTLPHLIAMILEFPSGVLIELLSKDKETAGMIASLKEAHDLKAEKQVSGVIGTLKNSLAQLNIPEIFYLLSKDETSLDVNNPNNPTFLCLGNDSSLAETFAPVISLIVSASARLMNQPNKLKSAIILDEAPTLYIPNFEQIPATARSNRVATVLGVQDISQMIDRYGRDKSQVLISNLGNQFFGRTVNEQTIKMITNLFGKQDVKYKSSSNSVSNSKHGGSESESISESYQLRDRVKVSDIINARPGQFWGVVAQGNQKEILGAQLHQVESNYKPFKKRTTEDPTTVFNQIYKDIGFLIKESPTLANNSDEIIIDIN